MSAIAAYPDAIAVAREHQCVLNVLQQLAITCLVGLFNLANLSKLNSQFLETFFLGLLRHTVVHVGPLVVFAFGGNLQVLAGVANLAAMQVLIPQLGMFFLVVSRLFEDGRNLFEPIFLCFRCEEGVLGACHTLACKCLLQVFLCFCSF